MADATVLRILRYEVPVDDRWHEIYLSGEILTVAARRPDVVEFWAYSDGSPGWCTWLRVYGTGHPITDRISRHHGTAIAAGGALVWHLLEGHGITGEIVRERPAIEEPR